MKKINLNINKIKTHGFALLLGLVSISLHGAGILTPVDSNNQAIQIRNHHVDVTINNGFAMTRFEQTFFNPNAVDLEATYSFPVPENASLSEMTVYSGESVLRGEVIRKKEAERIYQEEKDKGNDTGLATKNGYQDYQFNVFPVRAGAETRIEVVYYQSIKIDTGMGRYQYPLEEGGTDEVQESFWLKNSKVEKQFSINVTLKSSSPITDIRSPNTPGATQQNEDGSWSYRYESQGGSLNRDFVFYYRLQDNLPGQVELITHKPDENKAGTFMMVVTPGADLQPINNGADYIFVLDKSGSMSSKIHTLAAGVEKALGKMKPHDRFRMIVFDNDAKELSSKWLSATKENVLKSTNELKTVTASGGTNIYSGLKTSLKHIDHDRPTSLILVTDGVTNTGIIKPIEFHKLMKAVDIRVFGFLMGNSSNWPLMRVICESSGGFYATVSNEDDIVGKILEAKGKLTHEALHDVDLKIKGVRTFDVTKNFSGKIYRGQQLVIFGKYEDGGAAKVSLVARKTGADKTYKTEFDFPDRTETHPELERLWAMSKIEEIELLESIGKMKESETKDAIADIGEQYQIVTDHTAMLLLKDDKFKEYNIERRNLKRTEIEHRAQAARNSSPPQNHRADTNKPMFSHNAPSFGGGAGAMGWESAILLIGSLVWFIRRKD